GGGHASELPADGARRLGARLLPAIPDGEEPLLRGDLEPVELERRRAALLRGTSGRRAAGAGGRSAGRGASLGPLKRIRSSPARARRSGRCLAKWAEVSS